MAPRATDHALGADVPACSDLVYGTAAPDKDQRAAVAPYRDHTAWMAGHQLERAHRDRSRRAQHADAEPARPRPRDG